MKKFFSLFVIAALLVLGSCSKDSTGIGGDGETGYFTDNIQPLLNEYKDILNANGIYPPGLNMDSWDELIKGWERGEVIIPFDADNSLLVELTTKLNNQNELSQAKLDTLIAWINDGAKNDNDEVPYANATNLLYVCSQGEAIVNVIDMDAKLVVRNIDLTDFGYPADAKPHFIEFTPDGNHFFVSCIDPAVDRVVKLTTDTFEKVGDIETRVPALMAHHPTENVLYVSRFVNPNVSVETIFAINSETLQPAETGNDGDIILPPNSPAPHTMAISKTGDYVYTSSLTEDKLIVVDHATKEFAQGFDLNVDNMVEEQPLQGTISNDNTQLYLSCRGIGEVFVIDIQDIDSLAITSRIALGGTPWHSTFNSDGSKFYVGNSALNNFSVIDVASGTPQAYGIGDGSDGLSQPHGIAISDDDQYVFISNRNTTGNYQPHYDFGDNGTTGTVVVVNTTTNSVEKVIEIEGFGSGMKKWNK